MRQLRQLRLTSIQVIVVWRAAAAPIAVCLSPRSP